jgi:hypothetical protein
MKNMDSKVTSGTAKEKKMLSPLFQMLGAFIFSTVVPTLVLKFKGCFGSKDYLFFFDWHCSDAYVLVFSLMIVTGAILILLINVRSKKHSILWYLIAIGMILSIGGLWFLAWALSHMDLPA